MGAHTLLPMQPFEGNGHTWQRVSCECGWASFANGRYYATLMHAEHITTELDKARIVLPIDPTGRRWVTPPEILTRWRTGGPAGVERQRLQGVVRRTFGAV